MDLESKLMLKLDDPNGQVKISSLNFDDCIKFLVSAESL